jgi:hypothetical protein
VTSGRTGRVPVLLVLVLLLVLGAFALLLTALVTSTMSWAWGSVAASATAGVLLVTDWIVHRGRRTITAGERPVTATAEAVADLNDTQTGDTPDRTTAERTESSPRRSGPAEASEGSDHGTEPAGHEEQRVLDPDREPPEEDTDAADAIAVSELDREVVVIDERPRYHLAGCRWVGDRATIPLPVREARELGFTPCSVCTPDARLAAERRRVRGS